MSNKTDSLSNETTTKNLSVYSILHMSGQSFQPALVKMSQNIRWVGGGSGGSSGGGGGGCVLPPFPFSSSIFGPYPLL